MTTPSLVPPLLFGVPLREVLTGQWHADVSEGVYVHVYLNRAGESPYFEMYAHAAALPGACLGSAIGADFAACAMALLESATRRAQQATAAAAAMERAA